MKKLQGQNYYTQAKENFTPAESGDSELGEDVVNELTNAFTIPQFNEDLKDMFPLLHSIHQKRVAETTVDLDTIVGEASAVAEMDPDSFFEKVADANEDGFDMLHDAMMGKYGKAVEQKVQDMYNDVSADYGLHPDDDFEDIYDRMINNIEDDYGKTEDLDEFESWAESVMDEALDKQRIAMLNKMLGKHFPVGPDATNAINSLKGIIDDEGLKDELTDLAEKDPETCARPSIYRYIQQNDPEALDNLDFGDMRMEDDTTDVTIDKDGAMKLAGDEEEPKDEKASTEDIIEFVRSFYDTETGAFPKGETGVVISARKRFGDSVGDLVEKFVSKLTGNKVQVEDEEDVEEGSIKYMHSLKAKGHSDEEIAKELNMSADEVKKAMSKTDEGILDKMWDASKQAIRDPNVDWDKTERESDMVYALQDAGYSDKQIRQAYGILNDPRYKRGNLTGAMRAIEKVAPGMSDEPALQKVVKATQESTDLNYITDKLAKLLR